MAGATADAAATMAVLTGAEAVGTTLAIAIGVTAAVALLLLIVLIVLLGSDVAGPLRTLRRRMHRLHSPPRRDPWPSAEVPPTIETAPGAEPD